MTLLLDGVLWFLQLLLALGVMCAVVTVLWIGWRKFWGLDE